RRDRHATGKRHRHGAEHDDQCREDGDPRQIRSKRAGSFGHWDSPLGQPSGALNTVHLNAVQYTDVMTSVRYDRQSIIDRTLGLLDDVGLPDLSMRRLATELDVQPSALYWHFESKQELLGAVADRILLTVPDPDDRTPLMRTATAVRDALLAYRDGAEVVLS